MLPAAAAMLRFRRFSPLPLPLHVERHAVMLLLDAYMPRHAMPCFYFRRRR